MKKFELTQECIIYQDKKLYKIKALSDFGYVKRGDLGGFVERENNLSQEGNAWICDNANVYGDAKVYGDAWVCGDAEVYGNAKVYGDAEVYGNAKVCGDAKVYGNAWVCGDAKVYGDAWIYGNAEVYGDAEVYGNAWVCGDAKVYGDAKVCKLDDYIVFKNFWSSGRYFTWTRSNDMWSVGCFQGTGKELIEKAYKDSETSGKNYEKIVNYVESIK